MADLLMSHFNSLLVYNYEDETIKESKQTKTATTLHLQRGDSPGEISSWLKTKHLLQLTAVKLMFCSISEKELAQPASTHSHTDRKRRENSTSGEMKSSRFGKKSVIGRKMQQTNC